MEYSTGRESLQKPDREGQEELSGVIHGQAYETIEEFFFQESVPRHKYVRKIEAYSPRKGHDAPRPTEIRIPQERAGPGNHDGDNDYIKQDRYAH